MSPWQGTLSYIKPRVGAAAAGGSGYPRGSGVSLCLPLLRRSGKKRAIVSANAVLFLGALLLYSQTSSAEAPIYKWLDERGVVNYGQEPPEGRHATAMPKDVPNFVVVPSERLPQAVQALVEEDRLRRRVEQFEAFMEQAQRERGAASIAADERERRWNERCREHRVADCDAERASFVGPSIEVVTDAPTVRKFRSSEPRPTATPSRIEQRRLEPPRNAPR